VKVLLQLGGLALVIACLGALSKSPSSEVKKNVSLCEANSIHTPTTVRVQGLVSSYELRGITSSLVITSLDGCKISINASQDVIGGALTHLGKEDTYVTVEGEMKDGVISPKVGSKFLLKEVVRKCDVPLFGWYEENEQRVVTSLTRTRFNPTPVRIEVNPNIKEGIPQDEKWHLSCTQGGVVVSVNRN
jgi:hypothetical protein